MARKNDPINDDQLLVLLQQEAEDAVGYYNSDIAAEQENALNYYYGRPFGDELEGRSTVVSRDVAETVDWIMPDLMRVFTQTREAVKYEPQKPEDEAFAEQATDYANHVFFSDNKGQTILHDFAFDGLVQKLGVVRVDWQEPEYGEKESYEGLNVMQVMALENDPLVDIVEAEAEPDETMSMQVYPDGMKYELSIRRRDDCGRIVISCIPPEEFLVSRMSSDIDKSRYVAHRTRKSVSELIEMFPDFADEIEGMGGNASDDETFDTREFSRFRDEEQIDRDFAANGNTSERQIMFYDEYYRVDTDGDGISELRNIKRAGHVILENEEVSYNAFAAWTPIKVAHKLYGLSLADKTMDIQRIKSVLQRAALDSTYLSVAPRYAVQDGAVNMDDLLTVRPGGAVRTKGDPSAAMMPLVVPNQSADALQMLEYADKEKEGRTGISKHSQGLDPDSLNNTASGTKLLMNAAAAQKELIARNMAEGVECLFRKILKTIVRNQDGPRTIQLRGKWVPVDPRSWNAEMKVSVHVGLGTGSRETEISYLNLIKQTQENILLQAGPNNPIVTMVNYYNTLERMVEAVGFRSAEPYFTNPEEAQQQPPTPSPPDPKLIEVQQKGQLAQMQMQQDAQIEQAKLIQDGQIRQAQFMADMQMKAQQIQIEALLKKYQMNVEAGLSQDQAQIEAALAKYGIDMDAMLNVHATNIGVRAQIASAKITSDVRMGGEVG